MKRDGPMPLTPDRNVVELIIRAEAKRAKLPFEVVLGGSRARLAVEARRKAIRRIMTQTGCSARGVARAWGLSEEVVKKWVRRDASPYTAITVTRLTWAHGPDRARAIVEGRDPATQADLAAWRALGKDAAQ